MCWMLCCLFAGEEVRAEFFMEELNNGVKLCQLIGVLQTKIAQSCPSAACKVSPTRQPKGGTGERSRSQNLQSADLMNLWFC